VHLVLPSKARRCCGAQVEFNKAALSLSDAIPTEQRKAALNRLLKVRRSRVSMALSACCAGRHARLAGHPAPLPAERCTRA